VSSTNVWLQSSGSQHSIVESRYPSPLDAARRPTVLLDRVCVHVHETRDGDERFLCARPTEGGAWCADHDRDGDRSAWRRPDRPPDHPLSPQNVVAFVDGLWIDVNTLTRVDTNESVDFVDSVLIW